ncbi:hypothetical protein R3W88_032542 [Solanum pinnatisectum]|uniref:Uncharacterized protein n=1 Tax=Solanum pinnatisectum TaxID=50273 RepID=A0AAV9LT29_9SOLN|nr:hypothetical protein R3W88_032542 [Solanum pinnatisectum]
MEEKGVDATEDQISKLPEPILQNLLFLLYGTVDNFYSLPEEFLAAKKLNVLGIQGFKLELPLDHGIKFSYLQKFKSLRYIFGRTFCSSFMCKLQCFRGFKVS